MHHGADPVTSTQSFLHEGAPESTARAEDQQSPQAGVELVAVVG